MTAATAKSPVLCLEYLITARAEAFKEHSGETDALAYFRDALAFLEARHGSDKIVAVNVQNDESAPHLVAYVAPLVERPARTVRKSVFSGGRDDLAQAFERMTVSPYFDSAGHLTDMGRRAVASATDPAASQPPRPAEPEAPNTHHVPPAVPRGPGI